MSGPEPDEHLTAGVVLIGNELLTGKVRDENGIYLIDQMRRRGIDLEEIHIVADDVEAIAEAVNLVRKRRGICITSGGIGPTHDDVTMDGLGVAFAMQLEVRDDLLATIGAVFGSGESGKAWQKMAHVPTGTTMIPVGTGWPVYSIDNVFALPGIPEIFRRQVDSLLATMQTAPVYTNVAFFRIGEGELAGSLTELAQDFEGSVEIGSYPVLSAVEYKVKVTLDSRDPGRLTEATTRLLDAFPDEAVYEWIEHFTSDSNS